MRAPAQTYGDPSAIVLKGVFSRSANVDALAVAGSVAASAGVLMIGIFMPPSAWSVALMMAGAALLAICSSRATWLGLSAQTSRALCEVDEQLRATFDQAAVGIAHTGPDGQFLRVNQRLCDIVGYTREQLQMLTFQAITHPDDVAVGDAGRRALLANEVRTFTMEKRYVRPNGEVIWVSVTVSQVRDAAGAPKYHITVVDDINARKVASERLKWLSAAADQNPASVLITDTNGTIEYVNQRFVEVTGYTAKEAIGNTPRLFKSDATSPDTHRALWECLRKGETWRGDVQNRRKNGELYWDRVSISPLRNDAGVITHYLGTQTDITEHKSLEHQFRHAQKMEAVGRLAGGVAHDFNNLLTVILSYGDEARQGLEPGDQRLEDLEQVRVAALSAAQLTRQLLLFSRKQVAQVKPTEISQVVLNAAKMLKRVVGGDVEVRTRVDDGNAVVLIDPCMLDQVVMNLAVNARDAMPGGGMLTLTSTTIDVGKNALLRHPTIKPGPFALLSVADTGTGMDEDTIAHAFEPFFTTKGEGKGTGLGLSTVFGIVGQSGGFVEVDSKIGIGTTFKIHFPLADSAALP